MVRSTDWTRQLETDNAARLQFAQLIGDLGACLRMSETEAHRIHTGLILAGRGDSPLAESLRQAVSLLEEARDAVKRLSVSAD